jgi:hypothetical protein
MAHEHNHIRPCGELPQERLAILEIDEKVFVRFGFELPFKSSTIPIPRDACHDAWPSWPGVSRRLLADQGVMHLEVFVTIL